ncbi:MAG: ATP-binding cassette domain-containing protein [Rectinema sp.]|nr:ATP-binding cassette domain-containing protein [Rectinema sp.]
MLHITKQYLPSCIRANDDVCLEVVRGSIHAIVGENGAGKSTLMKILAGIEHADSGTIEIGGRTVEIRNPSDARMLGIGMVHQHFQTFNELSAAENILIGIEPLSRTGLIDRKSLLRKAFFLVNEYGFSLDPEAPAGTLAVGARQQVEILRQLARNVSILILDEPTSVLTEQEIQALFCKLIDIKKKGHTILIITHKIDEVMEIADYVTVMRDGKTAGTFHVRNISAGELSRLVMGTTDIISVRNHSESHPGSPILSIADLSVKGKSRGRPLLDHLSFTVHEGEVLGICALGGNGLEALEDVLGGFLPPSKGTCVFKGKSFLAHHYTVYRHFIRNGNIAYLPSDRMRRGMAPHLPVQDNFIALARHRYFKKGWLNARESKSATLDAISRFRISAHPQQKVEELSGGNIQKLALARIFSFLRADLLILCDPTWGLDMKTTEEISRRILDARNKGTAVLLLSSDVDEILSLSDRVIVLYRGKANMESSYGQTLTRERIGLAMLGNTALAESVSACGDLI